MAVAKKKKWFALDVGQRISFTALLLSVSSFAYAVFQYLQGADIALLTPTMVEFRPYHGGTYGAERWSKVTPDEFAKLNVMLKGSTMDYRNSGGAQYAGLVRYEKAILSIIGSGNLKKRIELDWQYFNDSDTPATPAVVPGSSVLTHETWFFPRIRCDLSDPACGARARENFLPWTEFRALLLADPKPPLLQLEFVSTVIEDRQIEKRVQCRVALDNKTLADLRDERWPYFSLPCCSEENADLVCRPAAGR